MKAMLAVVVVLVLVALFVFGHYVTVRNQAVIKNEAVRSAWAQVDVVLQRRADLIPNLVETVKGIAKQEQTVFGDIARARSSLLSANTPAGKIAANQQLDSALGGHRRELSPTKIQRELSAFAGRTGWHRKPHRCRTQALQRHFAGLQHLHFHIPQQSVCILGRVQTQRRLLCGQRIFSPGSQS